MNGLNSKISCFVLMNIIMIGNTLIDMILLGLMNISNELKRKV